MASASGLAVDASNCADYAANRGSPAPILQQPPLPAEPPPQAASHHNVQLHNHQGHYQLQSPYTQPTWQSEAFLPTQQVDIPPISSLLLREADAWRAVLSLHASVVTSAQTVARSPDNVGEASIEDKQHNTNSREAAYCSALSSLASQCDALFNEILKIRSFRKARRAVEVECVSELMRAHCDEVLAIGQTLATNGALSVSSATAELRAAIQAQRNQVSQLRVFLETIRSSSGLTLPPGAKLVVGVRVGDEDKDTRDLDDVLKEIYSTSRELTDTTLSETLSRLFLKTPVNESLMSANRQFARRAVDREIVESQH